MITIQYEYNNLILNNSADSFLYHIDEISGLPGSPGLRETRENKAAMHGQNDYGQYLAERLIQMHGEILATSVTLRNTARLNLENAFLADGGYRWLKYQVLGEVTKQVYCKVLEITFPEKFYKSSPYIREFAINLIAVDPRIYSQTETTSTIQIPTSIGGFGFPLTFPLSFGTTRIGGSANCVNSGNFESLPIVRIFGPLVNPKIQNNSVLDTVSGKYIKVNTTIVSGDYIEIDFNEHTIMLNGTASRYLYLDSLSEWWILKSGNNDITFTDSAGNILGYAQIIYRSAWI